MKPPTPHAAVGPGRRREHGACGRVPTAGSSPVFRSGAARSIAP